MISNSTKIVQELQYQQGAHPHALALTNPKNGSCSGAGCCEVDVPTGLESYYYPYYKDIVPTGLESYYYPYYKDDIDNSSRKWAQKNQRTCRYIVVMEKAAFNFSTVYLHSTT